MHARIRSIFVSFLFGIAIAAGWLPAAGAVAAIGPGPGPGRVSGFIQPTVDLTHTYLLYAPAEPGDAGVSPFVVSLDAVGAASGAGVSPFAFRESVATCIARKCAYTVLAIDAAAGSDSVVVALGLQEASDAVDGALDFDTVFSGGVTESSLALALQGGDLTTLQTFFIDNVGVISGAGVSPFIPSLAQLAPGANPTPHPDCPPLSAGANPTPYPDCPGAGTLVSFSTASFAGTVNAEVSVPEPATAALAALMIGGLVTRRKRGAGARTIS